jgi:hypothetical protein
MPSGSTHCLGDGYPGSYSQGHQWVLVSLCRHFDMFTKWPEATPFVTINKQSTVKFIKSIVYRFGVPNHVIVFSELL